MPVWSVSRGSPAAKSIRLALRTSSIAATSTAILSHCALRCFGRRHLSSALKLFAISLMPFMMGLQGPPRAESLPHTPLRHVNNIKSELIDGKVVRSNWIL